MDPKKDEQLATLEDKDTVVQNDSTATSGNGKVLDNKAAIAPEPPTKPKQVTAKRGGIRNIISRLNIYALLFVLIMILAAMIVFVSKQNSDKNDPLNATSQTLTVEDLEKLSSQDTSVGDPKQTLSVEANADFKGTVLVRGGLDVAGTIRVGGALTLPGITVSGISNFETVQIDDLTVTGDTTIQGQLIVQSALTITGGASFGGEISAPSLSIGALTLNNDIVLNRHIDAGGSTPTRTNGAALGGGGTSSVSGSDTAGTVTIGIGAGAPTSGCFTTITFAQAFNEVPHVVITPVGASAATLAYYITRTTTSFSICHNTGSAPSGSFSFDYVAID